MGQQCYYITIVLLYTFNIVRNKDNSITGILVLQISGFAGLNAHPGEDGQSKLPHGGS